MSEGMLSHDAAQFRIPVLIIVNDSVCDRTSEGNKTEVELFSETADIRATDKKTAAQQNNLFEHMQYIQVQITVKPVC